MEARRFSQIALNAACAAALCLAVQPNLAVGQGRTVRSIGAMRTIGSRNNFGSTVFRTHSYGLRSPAVSGGGAPTGTGVNMTIHRAGTGAAASQTGTTARKLTPGTRKVYQANQIRINTATGGGGVRAEFAKLADERVRLGQSMRTAFGLTESPLLADGPITTFAPDNRGRYADYLQRGEGAMKVGSYSLAAEQFRRANYIGPRRPETLLSLAHVDFAEGNYASMAHYLRLAIEYFPDLPGKDIQLRQFFQDSGTFLALRDRLVDTSERWPEDANLWMALAYVHWFDGEVEGAVEAMRNVVQTSRNPRLTDAAGMLWQNCVATGKVSGSVLAGRPRTRPAPKTTMRPKTEPKTETEQRPQPKSPELVEAPGQKAEP